MALALQEGVELVLQIGGVGDCLLYTSDAADERSSVDLGGRRIIKKKKNEEQSRVQTTKADTYEEN